MISIFIKKSLDIKLLDKSFFDIIHLLSFLPLKGGDVMLSELIVAVMAGVIVYYICKWLDRHL